MAKTYFPGRIVVVGPVAPFRGGIAQHTTRLANALSELIEVEVVSFERLYPRWLYPGKFQTEENGIKLKPEANFLLDPISPRSWHKAVKYISAQSPSCVIIPWWTIFMGPCYRFIASRLRSQNIPVLFFCHNVVDHETALWKNTLTRLVLKLGVGYVVQARDEEVKLRNLLGNIEVMYHPHPIYDQFPQAKHALPHRAKLELLFYGFIRPYKGLDILLEAMAMLKHLDVCLSIVGEPWGDAAHTWTKRISELRIENKVEFVPRYVSDEETADYFARADAVVLPYRYATGTGVIATAYHYRKPVIASDVGGLRDVVINGKTGLMVRPGDPEALRLAILRFSERGIPDAAANISHVSSQMSWSHMALQLCEFCHLVSDRRNLAS